ncbi:MAG: hypothetical protein M5U28_29070 [Sandaracinaceae bacterium]|nr:hypothetical protein [Sandaracinaceae bacterium]
MTERVETTMARAAITMLISASMFMPRAWITAAENAAVSEASWMRSRYMIASPMPHT